MFCRRRESDRMGVEPRPRTSHAAMRIAAPEPRNQAERWEPFWRLNQNRLLIAFSTGPVHNVGSVTDEFLKDVVAWDVHGFRPRSAGTDGRPILADMSGLRSVRGGAY